MRRFLHHITFAITLALSCVPQPGPGNSVHAQASIPSNVFADSAARQLLARAREARSAQDSALRYYDALSNLRVVFRAGWRAGGSDRLLMSSEQAARVKWSRANGVEIERTGARDASAIMSADLIAVTPVPYWVGRDALWLPVTAGLQTRELHEGSLKHPLANGAEQFYRYASGDSLSIRIGNNQTVRIQELRITPLRADWHVVVGSFWFDVESGSLVRAAYRLSAAIDVWEMDSESQKSDLLRALERAMQDSTKEGAKTHASLRNQLHPSLLNRLATNAVKGSFQPLHLELSAVAIEYGLFAGRFWLPRMQTAEATLMAGAMRVPMQWEERLRFDSIAGDGYLPVDGPSRVIDDSLLFRNSGPATLPPYTSAQLSDSLFAFYAQRVAADRLQAARAATKGDTTEQRRALDDAQIDGAFAQQVLRQREGCRNDSTYFAGTMLKENGALRVDIRLPCDSARLASSPDLSAINNADSVFTNHDRNALYQLLDMSLQPGWSPQAPELMIGLSLLRYNRIEGLSLAAATSSALGRGFTTRAEARYGLADKRLNGEISLARSNGASQRAVTAFQRLSVANDVFGSPLSFGASLANVLFARDEGFYYRSSGAELTGNNSGSTMRNGLQHQWRLFAERQRSAGVQPNTQASLANAVGRATFTDNFSAAPLSLFGMGFNLARTFGASSSDIRFTTQTRAETAVILRRDSLASFGYGRASAEATLSGGLSVFHAGLTTAVGTSAGTLPVQRSFFVGGQQTVRGQIAQYEGNGRVGTSFWLTRAEFGLLRSPLLRASLFFDAGWAGSRAELFRHNRPLTGAGVGISAFDGLLRFDAARGIWPEKRWRYSLYLGARF